jgi:hypothetical protein
LTACSDSHRPRLRFRFGRDPAADLCCLRHAIVYRPLLKTALVTAAVVGTVLTAINQGNVLLGGNFPAELWWKIPLTYSVPYCVSTFSALRISRA